MQVKYYSLPTYFVVFLLLLVFYIKRSFEFPYEIFVVSLFLCTVPNLFIKRFNILAIAPLEILFLVLLVLFLKNNGFFVVGTITVVSTAWTIGLIWKNRLRELNRFPDILGIILLAFLSAHFFWFSGFFDLDYKMRIINGVGQTDTFFHMAISNMIRNEFIPSTGLNFTPYHPYHYLSHFIFAVVSKLTSLKIYQVYSYAVPFLLFPLFIQFLKSIIEKNSRLVGHFLILPVLLFGLFPLTFPDPLSGAFFVSESQFLGIIFIFAFLYTNTVKLNSWINIPLIFMSFLAKISVGMLLFFSYFLMVLVGKYSFKKKLLSLFSSLLSVFLAVLVTVIIGIGAGSDRTFTLSWLYQYKLNYPSVSLLMFLWIIFHIFFLMLITVFISKSWLRPRLKNFFLVVAITAFFMGLIGINLKIPAWNWFTNLAMWVSLPYLLIFSVDIFHNFSANWKKYLLLLLLALFTSPNLFGKFKVYLSEYQGYFDKKLALTQEGERFLSYYNALEKAGQFDRESRYVVEIPRSEGIFWQHGTNPSSMPFYIPIISGRPAINAVNASEFPEFPDHSYSQYWYQPSINLCRDTKYKGIIRIWRNYEDEVVFKPFDCNSSGSIEASTVTPVFRDYEVGLEEFDDKFDFIIGNKMALLPFGLLENFDKGWVWPTVTISPRDGRYPLVKMKERLLELKTRKPIDKVDLLVWHGVKRIEEVIKWNFDKYIFNEYFDNFQNAINILKMLVDNDHDQVFIKAGARESNYFGMIEKILYYMGEAENRIQGDVNGAELKKFNDEFREWVNITFYRWCSYDKFCYLSNGYDGQDSSFFISGNNVKLVNYGPVTREIIESKGWKQMNFNRTLEMEGFGQLYFNKGKVLKASLIVRENQNLLYTEGWKESIKIVKDSAQIRISGREVVPGKTSLSQSIKNLNPTKDYVLSFRYRTRDGKLGLKVLGTNASGVITLLNQEIVTVSKSEELTKFRFVLDSIYGLKKATFILYFIPDMNNSGEMIINNIEVREISVPPRLIIRKIGDKILFKLTRD